MCLIGQEINITRKRNGKTVLIGKRWNKVERISAFLEAFLDDMYHNRMTCHWKSSLRSRLQNSIIIIYNKELLTEKPNRKDPR